MHGDPFIEWNEENSAREVPEVDETEGETMNLQDLKDAAIKILVTNHDFSHEEATEAVDDSASDNSDMWNENADPESLATFLASDDNDD